MSRCKILQAESSGVYVLKLVGEVRLNSCSALDSVLASMAENDNFATLVVDLSEATLLDSTTLGMLAKLAIKAKNKSHFLPSIISVNPDVTRLLTTMGFESVYLILKEPASNHERLAEVSPVEMSEKEMRAKVLCAHKVLMDMNEDNREQFKDLVRALEGDNDEELSSKAG